MTSDCDGKLHPKAIEGMKLFNEGKYFESHEELETAWRDEAGNIRSLYQGILQIAVAYLHITRENYDGAIKVYGRALKWLNDYPDVCRGVNIGQLKKDAHIVINAVEALGAENISKLNSTLFKPIQWNEKRTWICDKCGSEMYEKSCKVSCPNCGNRFDCSDLNIYFD